MTKTVTPKNANSATTTTPTKHKQVIGLLTRDYGASLEELSTAAVWLPHSTRAFLTSLKKKGYVITSEKTDGIRRYRATPALTKTKVK